MKRDDLFSVVKNAVKSSGVDDVGLLAAGLTYYVFLSLFPLLLLGLNIATLFISQEDATKFIFQEVAKVIPGALDLLEEIVTAAYDNRSGLFLISLGVLAFSASNSFGTLDKAVNRAWGTEKMPNPVIAKLISFLMMAVLGGLIIVSLVLSAGLSFVQARITPTVDGELEALVGSLLFIVNVFLTIGFVFAAFLLAYRFLPKAKVHFSDVWLAALLGSLVWAVVKVGFGIYLNSSFANYNAVYGTLGTVVALLFWLYMSSIIILYGAEFAAEIYRLRVTRESMEVQPTTLDAPDDTEEQESPWFKHVTDNP